MTAAEYELLKSKLESVQRNLDRVDGALQEIGRLLDDKYNCKSIDEAKEKLAELAAEEEELNRQLEELDSEFETKWGPRLQELRHALDH